VQALEAYRQTVNPAVWVVVVSLTPVGYSIADHTGAGVPAVAGLDASLPRLISAFIR
jgi:60 kDa SS-A/Ro ribonucleoprotein